MLHCHMVHLSLEPDIVMSKKTTSWVAFFVAVIILLFIDILFIDITAVLSLFPNLRIGSGNEAVMSNILVGLMLLAGGVMVWLLFTTKRQWFALIGIAVIAHVAFYFVLRGNGAVAQPLRTVWILCAVVIFSIMAEQKFGGKGNKLKLLVVIVSLTALCDMAGMTLVTGKPWLGSQIPITHGQQLLIVFLLIIAMGLPCFVFMLTGQWPWAIGLLIGTMLHFGWFIHMSNLGSGMDNKIFTSSILMLAWGIVSGAAVLGLFVRLLVTFIQKMQKKRLHVPSETT